MYLEEKYKNKDNIKLFFSILKKCEWFDALMYRNNTST